MLTIVPSLIPQAAPPYPGRPHPQQKAAHRASPAEHHPAPWPVGRLAHAEHQIPSPRVQPADQRIEREQLLLRSGKAHGERQQQRR